MANTGLYAKAAVTAVVAALAAYGNAVGDGPGVTGEEWLAIFLVLVANAVGIFAVPNTPEGVRVYGKAVLAFFTAAGGNLLATGFTDGSLSQSEVVTAIVAGLVASGLLGVFVSNAASSDPVVRTASGRSQVVPISAAKKRSLVTGGDVPEQYAA